MYLLQNLGLFKQTTENINSLVTVNGVQQFTICCSFTKTNLI